MGFEPEGMLIIIIIISCGLMDIEKREDGLQVIHTANSRDQPVYPSSLALVNAACASVVLPMASRAKSWKRVWSP